MFFTTWTPAPAADWHNPGMTYAASHRPHRSTVPRQLVLLNDEPVSSTEEDLLGSGQAANALTGLIVGSRHATPFTLAVDAGWGMGKSSLMRLVDARLRQYGDVRTVWYNAWTSTGADALEGLIKSVLVQVEPSVLRRALRRVREGGALVKAARLLSLLVAGPLGVSGMVDELWNSLSGDATARNGMRDVLRELVGEWTAGPPGGAPGRLLVVFIDDLDRCSEESLLAVCEAVKVYLDVPGLAFVIGCDRAALGPGGLLRDLSPAGTAFMEKIFQTSYRIPAAGAADIHGYVRSCARHAGLEDLLDDRLVELLAYRADRNPRRVKRLVNGLLLEAHLNPIWADLPAEAVIRTLLLQYLYPDFHRMLTVPGGPGTGDDVVTEFRGYRRVRAQLWSAAAWPQQTAEEVDAFLRTHGVPLPADAPTRGQALTALERQLPSGFPALADDPAFVSLTDEFVALPEADVVLRRLRMGPDGSEESSGLPPFDPLRPSLGRLTDPLPPVDTRPQPLSVPPSRTDPVPTPRTDPVPQSGSGGPVVPPPYDYVLPPPGEQRPSSANPGSSVPSGAAQGSAQEAAGEFAGVSSRPSWYGQPESPGPRTGGDGRRPVLIVGFEPVPASRVMQDLRKNGLVTAYVYTDLAWTRALGEGPAAVVCHVHAFREDQRGFALVRAAKARGLDVPVAFYTPRLTPNDERTAGELGAVITDKPVTAVAAVVTALTAAGTGG